MDKIPNALVFDYGYDVPPSAELNSAFVSEIEKVVWRLQIEVYMCRPRWGPIGFRGFAPRVSFLNPRLRCADPVGVQFAA